MRMPCRQSGQKKYPTHPLANNECDDSQYHLIGELRPSINLDVHLFWPVSKFIIELFHFGKYNKNR